MASSKDNKGQKSKLSLFARAPSWRVNSTLETILRIRFAWACVLSPDIPLKNGLEQ